MGIENVILINLCIAGRILNLSIPKEEEGLVRMSARILDLRIKAYEERYRKAEIIDDILLMILFQSILSQKRIELKIENLISVGEINSDLFLAKDFAGARNDERLILKEIQKLPMGKSDNADQRYQDLLSDLLILLFSPILEHPKAQSRTISGKHIRDLVFMNSKKHLFLEEIYEHYAAKEIVIELKNTKEISRDSINQLNRYLTDEMGHFGILFTRNNISSKMYRNIMELWAGQRKCILVLSDDDLVKMCDYKEGRVKFPIDVIFEKYSDFRRSCPS